MSLKNLSLALACVTAFSAAPSFAMDQMNVSPLLSLDKSGSSLVCGDALQTICRDTEADRRERDQRVNALKNEIASEAARNAAPRIEEMKRQIKPIHFIKRMVATIKIKNQEIMKSASKRIAGFEGQTINATNVNRIKDYMYQAIDTSKFDSTTKKKKKNTVKSIVVGNFNDYIERTNLDDNVLAQLMGNACGSDGMVENAFATTIGSDKYVLICPGFLIGLNETPNESERFNSVLQAISHEMAHHIDNSKVGNELYSPFLNCVANNYADQFNKTKDDTKFCKKNEKDPAACNLKVTVSHAGELVADAWGIKVLNLHMRNQSYSFAQADELLTQSWVKLCDTGDEGIHPTGDFRIGTMLRKSPEISNYLACDNSQVSTKPACTLEGAVNL